MATEWMWQLYTVWQRDWYKHALRVMSMAIKRYLLTYFFAYLLNVLACLVATVSWQLSISVPEFRENVSILSLTGGKGI